nr:Na+/H+ antiporter NhaA [bacterium]
MTENNKSSHATGLAAPVRLIWDPVRHFILTENASGIILLIATIAALIWANLSPESYNGFWEIKAKFEVERFSMDLSLREWVNDALMTIFFLLVGLEIKREMLVGELSSFRQAILPVVAAAGGMMVPALIYTGIAGGTEVARGWGIPVATDIAFA